MIFSNEYIKDLNSNELRLLMIMKVMANGSDELEVSRPMLNEWMADVCDKTVKRTIDALEHKGYISKADRKGSQPTVYTFIK